MPWSSVYHGDGEPSIRRLPQAPPWRTFPLADLAAASRFQPSKGLVDAVNAALCLRRPLLLTGTPGSGKSTLIESVAAELDLGHVLRWHITSRSTLVDALYRYDVLGRIHAQQLSKNRHKQPGADNVTDGDDITPFIQLGPLGTALVAEEGARALLIDEIDKSDLDLPGDLLDVLERGEFEIPELVRHEKPSVDVREWDSERVRPIVKGRVSCRNFPFIVLTSNGERDFPAPFLRRCVRFRMPRPDTETVTRIVNAHLGQQTDVPEARSDLIKDFVKRVEGGESLALDQLLNVVFLLEGNPVPGDDLRKRLTELLMRRLSDA